jgi:hypothetical protein
MGWYVSVIDYSILRSLLAAEVLCLRLAILPIADEVDFRRRLRGKELEAHLQEQKTLKRIILQFVF